MNKLLIKNESPSPLKDQGAFVRSSLFEYYAKGDEKSTKTTYREMSALLCATSTIKWLISRKKLSTCSGQRPI